jgi:hypothetical protein
MAMKTLVPCDRIRYLQKSYAPRLRSNANQSETFRVSTHLTRNNGTESSKRTGKIAGQNRKRFKQAARSDVAYQVRKD